MTPPARSFERIFGGLYAPPPAAVSSTAVDVAAPSYPESGGVLGFGADSAELPDARAAPAVLAGSTGESVDSSEPSVDSDSAAESVLEEPPEVEVEEPALDEELAFDTELEFE